MKEGLVEKKNVLQESMAFTLLNEVFEQHNFRTITRGAKFNALESLHSLQFIGFVGSSCSGKSTLINELRILPQATRVPKNYLYQGPPSLYVFDRVVSRPDRSGKAREITLDTDHNVLYGGQTGRKTDNVRTDIENIFHTKDNFETRVRQQIILLFWQRQMEGNRVEYYGFVSDRVSHTSAKALTFLMRSVTPDDPSFPFHPNDPKALNILSANNDFARQHEQKFEGLSDFRDKGVMIGVNTSDATRAERFRKRPGNETLSKEEVAYRLGDSTTSILPLCHIIIDNNPEHEVLAKEELNQFIISILELKEKYYS